MDLLSVFKRKTDAVPETADAVQLARTRARQRLIGAAVLVVAGIIGFPLLFESQPRPIPVDLPIDIPRKDNVPPIAMPAAPPEAAGAGSMPAVAAKSEPSVERVITETQAEAGREVVAPSAPRVSAAPASPVAASAAPAAPAEAPHVTAATAPPPKASAPVRAEPVAGDGARAKALLEGRPVPVGEAGSPAAGTQRFVVQVGAFADAAAVRDVRAKVEKLGMTTYTQVAETPAGSRTRVRVGPFATRAEAERAAAKIKSVALPTTILTL